MNAVLTLRNNAEDLVEPDDTSVIALERTAGYKATIVDREHERFEQRVIVLVERNVEEHPIAVAWRRQSEPQTGLDLPLCLGDFDDSDFLAETVAVSFLDRLAVGFETFFGLCALGSAMAGPNWNPKTEERPILNEPEERFETSLLESLLRAFANRAAPRAFVCEIVPVLEGAIIARWSIGISIQRLNAKPCDVRERSASAAMAPE